MAATLALAVLTSLLATGIAVEAATPVQARSAPRAVVASQLTIHLTGQFHLLGRPSHVLAEQGSFTGTVSGPAIIHFTLITLTSGTATVVFSPAGGSISGRAVTRSEIEGANVYFGGHLTITSSTGKWSHTTGATLGFSGYLNRKTFKGTAHLSGTLNA